MSQASAPDSRCHVVHVCVRGACRQFHAAELRRLVGEQLGARVPPAWIDAIVEQVRSIAGLCKGMKVRTCRGTEQHVHALISAGAGIDVGGEPLGAPLASGLVYIKSIESDIQLHAAMGYNGRQGLPCDAVVSGPCANVSVQCAYPCTSTLTARHDCTLQHVIMCNHDQIT